MRFTFRPNVTAGVAIAGAGLIALPSVAPAGPDVAVRAVQLTSGETLGDGTALIIGGSGVPIPPPIYVQTLDDLYLVPRGFTGTAQGLDTPEGLYPITGIKTLTLDDSVAQGQQILDQAILSQIHSPNFDPANPVVVVGVSQSSTIASLTMQQLHDQGVPSDDVHFLLLSDPSNPDGGLLERFAGLSIPSLGITFSGASPADLYPADVYTPEYDGFSDFPRYPIDILADLNALFGIIYQHHATLTDTAAQIQDAIQLPTSSADTMTDYYVLPTDSLPLLQPLQAIPFIGKPLTDLLQPDLAVLINLGYGQIGGVDPTTGLITGGWDPGDADVPTPFSLFPTNLNWGDVLTALGTGLQQGIHAAIADLENPATYQLPSLTDALGSEIATGYLQGYYDTPDPSLLQVLQGVLANAGFPISDATLTSSPTDIINDISATLSYDYSVLLPAADSLVALLTSIPAYDLSLFTEHLQSGDLLGAFLDPIAADFGLVPAGLGLGAGEPLAVAFGGTLINLIDLFS